MSTLQVTVNWANLKKSSDAFGKMENYVYLRLVNGTQVSEHKTSIVNGEKEKKIVWGESFNIKSSPSENAVLYIEVRD
jgi:hypothetical protein